MYSNALPTKMLEGVGLERVHYFPRQLLTATDMLDEQEYFRQKLRRHNRFLHGWGVVCGCEVQPNPNQAHPWQVRVCPGYIITPQGDEILIAKSVDFDLAGDWRQAEDPCSRVSPCIPTGAQPPAEKPQTVYLAVCYVECETRPVRLHPVGCACDEAACEYSRIHDSFELIRLPKKPESHDKAEAADKQWCDILQQWLQAPNSPPRVPPCPEYTDEPCVVLAKITLPKSRDSRIGSVPDGGKICYEGRRVLYSTSMLQELCACMPHATAEVSISIQPKTANLAVGGTQQFEATVTGSSNAAVDWSVLEGATGGGITATGQYTAPQSAGSYHVVATSQADPSKRDTATVTVVAAPIAISIEPKTANMALGGSQQFTAIVTGTTNTAVDWSVLEGATGGGITATGQYTAPQSAGSYHVVATSQADPSKRDMATVTVVAAPIAISIEPKTANLPLGESQQFTAIVTGTTNTAVTWNVQETAGGTITAAGQYTAPELYEFAGIYHVVATSQADPSKSDAATVAVYSIG